MSECSEFKDLNYRNAIFSVTFFYNLLQIKHYKIKMLSSVRGLLSSHSTYKTNPRQKNIKYNVKVTNRERC